MWFPRFVGNHARRFLTRICQMDSLLDWVFFALMMIAVILLVWARPRSRKTPPIRGGISVRTPPARATRTEKPTPPATSGGSGVSRASDGPGFYPTITDADRDSGKGAFDGDDSGGSSGSSGGSYGGDSGGSSGGGDGGGGGGGD